METLRGVFPAVPTEALLRVLEVCDQSVALASTWLLENDWQELMLEQQQQQEQEQEEQEQEQEQEDNQVVEVESVAATAAAAAGNAIPELNAAQPPPYLVRRPAGALDFDEQFDEEDEDEAAEAEDDEDEDDEDDEMYYDSGDEAAGRAGEVPPLVKRVKISQGKDGKAGDDDFWVAFDDQVVRKSMIELLNTTLSRLAHSKVVLLNRSAKDVEEAEAAAKLRSVVPSVDKKGETTEDGSSQSARGASGQRGVALSQLLNENHSPQDSGDLSCSSDSPTTTAPEVPVGQKRKRTDDAFTFPSQGFFAHFFPVRDLDMVWRTVMHAHLFKSRFGETIEFHTACGGPFTKKDFDELLHIQNSAASSRPASLGFSPLGTLKCCLVLPCLADEEEILRIGKNIHSVLKVQGSLYFRLVDDSDKTNVGCPRDEHFELLGGSEKMTEERFRQFARYRVREEEAATTDSQKENKLGADPYMSYQQPRKSSYLLEKLEVSTWSIHRSS